MHCIGCGLLQLDHLPAHDRPAAQHGQDEGPGVMVRKGDTPEYINRMQQEVLKVLAKARSLLHNSQSDTKCNDTS
jgi:hypothetical protein